MPKESTGTAAAPAADAGARPPRTTIHLELGKRRERLKRDVRWLDEQLLLAGEDCAVFEMRIRKECERLNRPVPAVVTRGAELPGPAEIIVRSSNDAPAGNPMPPVEPPAIPGGTQFNSKTIFTTAGDDATAIPESFNPPDVTDPVEMRLRGELSDLARRRQTGLLRWRALLQHRHDLDWTLREFPTSP